MVALQFRRVREPKLLWMMSMRSIFVYCMGCPISALLLSFALGSVFHPHALFSYEWTCGTVHLPSISRVINMPLERTIVQVLLLFSVPLRLIVLLKHWLEYSVIDQSRWFVLVRRLMVLCGAADVLFLSLLSTIGERENGDLHVVLFAGFAASTYIYFVSICLLTKRTSDSSPSGALRAVLQLTFLSFVSFGIPVIFLLFILYNVFCVPFTYELFALFEYATVASIYAFHLSSLSLMTGSIYIIHNSIKAPAKRV